MKFVYNLLMDELKDDKVVTPPADAPPAAPPGELDEFGYEKIKPEDKKPEEPIVPPKEEPKEEEKPVEPVTGYDQPPKKEEEKPKDPPKEEPKKEEEKPKDPPADEFKITVAGNLLPDEVKDLETFVKTHKVSKEIAQALVEAKKAEVKKLDDIIKSRDAEVKARQEKIKEDWKKELREDKTFGGEKFEHNRKQVEKVLHDFFPNVKNKLTESKGMLPPYIMRDLAKLADHLYSTEKLVQGDPIKPKPTKEESNDPLDFYNQ